MKGWGMEESLEDTTCSARFLTLTVVLLSREVVSCKKREGGNRDKLCLCSSTLS